MPPILPATENKKPPDVLGGLRGIKVNLFSFSSLVESVDQCLVFDRPELHGLRSIAIEEIIFVVVIEISCCVLLTKEELQDLIGSNVFEFRTIQEQVAILELVMEIILLMVGDGLRINRC
jgi:hypothetical protein